MIRMDGKYRTRDGREARLYSVEVYGEWVVHGAVFGDGVWDIRAWKIDGTIVDVPHNCDLIEIKPAAIDRMCGWLESMVAISSLSAEYGTSMMQSVYQCALTEARRIKAEAEKETRDE